ncbi:hypothetical protein Hanom_Chr07g00634681 [Helianthus anomalus]
MGLIYKFTRAVSETSKKNLGLGRNKKLGPKLCYGKMNLQKNKFLVLEPSLELETLMLFLNGFSTSPLSLLCIY